MRTCYRLFKDTSGASAIEYAFIASLVSVAAVAAMISLGASVSTLVQTAVDAFT